MSAIVMPTTADTETYGLARSPDYDPQAFVRPHMFDDIVTDRALTHDMFGKLTRKWRVIYADPPWKFMNFSEEGEDRNANQHYDTMTIEQIMAMPVRDLADDDCVLYMWVTDPTIRHAMMLLDAWGFQYKTVGFYWTKTAKGTDMESMHHVRDFPMGNGYCSRANPEQLWRAVRGNPQRRLQNIHGKIQPDYSIRRQQFGPRGRHSEKPTKFYGFIERLWDGPYLELFGRRQRPGWGVWGNQVGVLDDEQHKTKKQKKERVPAPAPLFD